MEKHYKGSNILVLKSRVHSKSSETCIPYLPFKVDLTFGKYLEYMGRVNACIAVAHVQKIYFLQMGRRVPFKIIRRKHRKRRHQNLISYCLCHTNLGLEQEKCTLQQIEQVLA